MAYRMTWQFGKKKYDPELPNHWHPCFASLREAPKEGWPDVLSVHMWMQSRDDFSDPDSSPSGDSTRPDYEHWFMKGDSFKRLMNYWVHIGKLCGLRFDNFEWEYCSKTNILTWYLDLSFLKDIKVQERAYKAIHLHLFFLRLINEYHATVRNVIRYRKEIKKKYPHIPLHTTVIMCEKLAAYSKPPRANTSKSSLYWNEGHHLSSCLDKKQIQTSLKMNFWEGWARKQSLRFFDDEWFCDALGVRPTFKTIYEGIEIYGIDRAQEVQPKRKYRIPTPAEIEAIRF